MRKGSKAPLVLTTRFTTNNYNCLHFDYHMHGPTMGRLDVFGPSATDSRLLWRLAGDHGNEWHSAVIKIERGVGPDVIKVNHLINVRYFLSLIVKFVDVVIERNFVHNFETGSEHATVSSSVGLEISCIFTTASRVMCVYKVLFNRHLNKIHNTI